MKQCLSIFLILSILAPASFALDKQAPVQATVPVTTSNPVSSAKLPVKRTPDGKSILEDGTPVRLRLTRTLSSAECKTGDRIDFEVMDPLVFDGTTIIPQGGIAWGTVTNAEHKKSMGRAGKLDITIVAVKLANSEKANMRAVKEAKGGGHVGAMAGAMVATSIIFFPAAPLFLFVHGKDITIPQGTEIIAYVDGDKVFVPLAETAAPASNASVSATTELTLSSSPNGADIEIDGAFIGSTPSTVTLGFGDHTVGMSKKGFESYAKKLHTTGGKVNMNANLNAVGQ